MKMSVGKWARRAAAVVATGLLLGALAGCGGGTEQVTPFEPKRYFVFGDAMSVLTQEAPQGRKYSINALTDGSVDCAADSSDQPSRLWTQILGDTYDFVFAECNPSAQPVTAFGYAVADAKSTDFAAQLEAAQQAHGTFGCTDLVSVLIGANDVIDLFETVYLADPTSATADAVTNQLSARGARLGRAIAVLTENNGPAVIVSTIPLVNRTPYALLQARVHPDADVLDVLERFSNAFNTALRLAIPNDGSRWGLVELDAMISAAVNHPEDYDLDNVTEAVCTVDLPNCNNEAADLVPDGDARTWLWASDRWIAWRAHETLGSFARTRVRDNPFGCS